MFLDLNFTSVRLPGLHSGQQEMLILISRLAGDSGEWTGPRSALATELRCSVDTITRRKDALVQAGFISVTTSGRSLTYRLIKSAVDSLPRESHHGAPIHKSTTSARRWWQRPDANQLDLFRTTLTRQEARAALKSTTMQWVSLLVCAVFGPDARRTTPATAAAPMTSQPTTEPATPAANEQKINDKSAASTPSIGIGTSIPETKLQSPTDSDSTGTVDNSKSRTLKFCLWTKAQKKDFLEPKKVQEIYERLLKVGGCTPDERLQVFKFVANAVELATETDNLPGLITAILRGTGTPWRARGNALNERTAREMIKVIDVPAELQVRTGDLLGGPDVIEAERQRQLRIAREMIAKSAK